MSRSSRAFESRRRRAFSTMRSTRSSRSRRNQRSPRDLPVNLMMRVAFTLDREHTLVDWKRIWADAWAKQTIAEKILHNQWYLEDSLSAIFGSRADGRSAWAARVPGRLTPEPCGLSSGFEVHLSWLTRRWALRMGGRRAGSRCCSRALGAIIRVRSSSFLAHAPMGTPLRRHTCRVALLPSPAGYRSGSKYIPQRQLSIRFLCSLAVCSNS